MNLQEANEYIGQLLQGKVKPFSDDERSVLEKMKQALQNERDIRERISGLTSDLESARAKLQNMAGAREAFGSILVEAEAKRRLSRDASNQESKTVEAAVTEALGNKPDRLEVVSAKRRESTP